jgi:hypothetical protein
MTVYFRLSFLVARVKRASPRLSELEAKDHEVLTYCFSQEASGAHGTAGLRERSRAG